MTLWFFGALVIWWFVAATGCGGATCLPYVMFFYASYTWPTVIYFALAAALARVVSGRWSLVIFLALALAGLAALAAIARARTPSLFADWEASMTTLRLVFYPALSVAAWYLLRVLIAWRRA